MQSPNNRFGESPEIHLAQVTIFRPGSRRAPRSLAHRFVLWLCLLLLTCGVMAMAQTAPQDQSRLPFQVSNSQNKKWSPAEARRIYDSACRLLARTIRPDKPPELHPQFTLILGTEHDEFVRDGTQVEVHLRNWEPEMFAQAVVAIAVRDLLQTGQLQTIAHESVLLANSTVNVHDLR